MYRWINKVNGKSYIGSSVNLNARLSHYLSPNFLAKKILRSKSAIYNALLTYNYENFSLEILEYCDRSIVINREQYYLDKYEHTICWDNIFFIILLCNTFLDNTQSISIRSYVISESVYLLPTHSPLECAVTWFII